MYIIEFCIDTYEELVKDRIYRTYVTDGIKLLSGLSTRYADIVDFHSDTTDDNRSASDIITHLKDKLNKMGGE